MSPWCGHTNMEAVRFARFRPLASLFVLVVAIALSAHAQEHTSGTILVSRQLAESEGLEVGSLVRLSADPDGALAREFRIVGIYEPTPDPARLGSVAREVRLHLPELLDLTRRPDTPAGAEHVSRERKTGERGPAT